MTAAGKRTRRGGSSIRRAEIALQRRARTRQRLIEATAKVLAERGESRITIDACIRAARVARGTFYNYFPRREDVLDALWAHVGRTPFQAIRRACVSIEDPAERLAVQIRLLIERAAAEPIWGWVIYGLSDSDETLNDELKSFPLPELEAGHAAGRFGATDPRIHRDVLVGSVRAAIRSVLAGSALPDYASEVAIVLLRGLGIDPAEATALGRRPLPLQG
jgi:AcrR family transcriptional regulator